jgi:uncharacterized protein (TIGR03790 family)
LGLVLLAWCAAQASRGAEAGAAAIVAPKAHGTGSMERTNYVPSGKEAIVVFNSRMPESKAVAEHYARQRQVPAEQVLGFDLPTAESITRLQFQDSLQKPLAAALEERQLWHIQSNVLHATTNRPAHVAWRVVSSKVRYAVLCYGVPLRILEESSIKEEGDERLRPELRRNMAAVDSELALLPLIDEKPPLNGWVDNPAYAATNRALLHPTNGVLIVARLDGPTADIARGLVDKALTAETNGLWGRAYFDLIGAKDGPRKLGDDWIRRGSEICRLMGFETVVDEKSASFPAGFPMSQIAYYLGWYDENVSGPFAQPTVEFMPGAFAYHLHSSSAASLRTTNQFWAGPLLAKGATATMGCVFEPYLAGTPDLATFTARFMLLGFSFGEAACASQRFLSWQVTVVGDPLYRPPPGDSLDRLLLELEQRHSPYREWAWLRLVNFNLANGKPLAASVAFLEQMELVRHSAVLTEKLADLYVALGKPSSAAREYAQALTLEPSPQQRVRLRFGLGETLVALGREAEAYENYEKLLEEFPKYPDVPGIYRRLLPLAKRLNKTAEVEKYEAALRPAGPGQNGSSKK